MLEIIEEEEIIKQRCEKCAYNRPVYATDQWNFRGCYHKPYEGKWVAEIKRCPKE